MAKVPWELAAVKRWCDGRPVGHAWWTHEYNHITGGGTMAWDMVGTSVVVNALMHGGAWCACISAVTRALKL